MKAQFIVTVEGDWLENGKDVTAAMAEKRLREAVKEAFGFLADRTTVKKLVAPLPDARAKIYKAQEA